MSHSQKFCNAKGQTIIERSGSFIQIQIILLKIVINREIIFFCILVFSMPQIFICKQNFWLGDNEQRQASVTSMKAYQVIAMLATRITN